MATYASTGPWGGRGGEDWSYLFRGELKEILIDAGGGYIKSIAFKDEHGYSPWFGASNKGYENFERFSLDGPEEYLVRIEGSYGQFFFGYDTVNYLTFATNHNKIHKYGTATVGETDFSIPIKSGRVVGFHGRCGGYVDAIGAHVAPASNP